ncbi:MAG: hypothetical protein ACI4EI_00795 [Muricoprocola sp.]
MLKTSCEKRKGFEVLHNSEGWRLAIHAYEPEMNGIPSLKNWGRHLDSQEAFLLLKGKGWLATCDEAGNYAVTELSQTEILIVEKAERHAILLAEGSSALIVENQDMSNSVNEAMKPEVIEAILAKVK